MHIVLIGLGKMGQYHLNNIVTLPGITKISAFDVNPDAFTNSDDRIEYTTDVDTIDLASVDCFDIVAPTQFHLSYLQKFLPFNKPIFVEKPLVTNHEQLEALRASIADTGYDRSLLSVGFIERYNAVIGYLSNYITENGKPLQLDCNRHNPASGRIGDVGVTEDLMIHDIDIVRFLLGGSLEVGGKAIETQFATVLGTVDDTAVRLSSNRITQLKMREVILYYEDITIVADLVKHVIISHHKPEKYLSTMGTNLSTVALVGEDVIPKTNQLYDELADFVSGSRERLASYHDGEASIDVLTEIL